MTVIFLTICLDGLPWIASHWPTMRTLPFKWEWHICEGVARNVHCSRWCKKLPARLSNDGTSEYLDSISFDKRVHIHRKKMWQGKIEMVNEPLKHIKEPCLLWEIDSDEVYTADQIIKMRSMFMREPERTSAQFFCRYFVGPDIVTATRGSYGNRNYDWHRVWSFTPGQKFITHEPPVLVGPKGETLPDRRFTQQETADAGLVFDHYAYALKKTVEFKSAYYTGCENAVAQWNRLQENAKWPCLLKNYFSWVNDNTEVRRL
jgi:hypothetical protein